MLLGKLDQHLDLPRRGKDRVLPAGVMKLGKPLVEEGIGLLLPRARIVVTKAVVLQQPSHDGAITRHRLVMLDDLEQAVALKQTFADLLADFVGVERGPPSHAASFSSR